MLNVATENKGKNAWNFPDYQIILQYFKFLTGNSCSVIVM